MNANGRKIRARIGLWVVSALAFSLLAGCYRVAIQKPIPASLLKGAGQTPSSPTPAPSPLAQLTHTPFASPSPRPSPPPVATHPPPAFFLPGYLPAALADPAQLPPGFTRSDQAQGAAAWLDVFPESSAGSIEWVYALAAPFPTVPDGLSSADLRAAWMGLNPSGLPFDVLLVDESTRGVFEKLWGPPAALVRTLAPDQLVDTAWKLRPLNAWAILPFEELEPRWKVLSLDGQSPLRKEFNPSTYGLTVAFDWQGPRTEEVRAVYSGPLTNRDPSKLTTVILTGTTSFVRGTASLMETVGLDYPALDIAPLLKSADILHISNEISFDPKCPPPFDWQGFKFCSRPKYIKVMEDIGTDVVDMAGDHIQDWGDSAILYTVQMYQARGWQYFGGGENLKAAQAGAHFTVNHNKIAFLGCNAKDPGYATVSDTQPGALHCDFNWLAAAIRREREAGYLPIVTLQDIEYWSYETNASVAAHFKIAAQAGAVIVSGTGAHQPQPFHFEASVLPAGAAGEGPVVFEHYGLGNLFFDQHDFGLPVRQNFIDRHVFYNGKYLGVELFTTTFVDDARVRFMTPEERADLLKTLFTASGW